MDYNKIKKQLSDAVKIKSDKEDARAREKMMEIVGADLAATLAPLLAEMAGQSAGNSEVLVDKLVNALKSVKIQVPDINPKIEVNVPDVYVPQIELPIINVPQPRVNVNVPNVIVPELKMPTEMNVRGMVSLEGINLQNPLPVQLRDKDGKPVNLLENLTTIIGGGSGGGKNDYFTIKGFNQSAFAEFMNPDGRIKVEMPAGASGLTDLELRASSVPVEQVSGSMWSVYVSGSTGTIGATILDSSGVQYSGSNPLPVVITSGAAATTAVQNLDGDGNYRGTFPVEGTVAVSGVTGSIGATILDAEGNYRESFPIQGTVDVSGITASISASIIGSDGLAFGTSKPIPVTMVTGVSASVNAAIINSDGTYRDTFPISGTVIASSVTASVQATIIDSSGIGYSGSNPLPTTIVSGYLTSCVAVGATLHDAADVGAAPQKVGGVAVTTANPTAVAGGDIVNFRGDDLGRQLIRPVQVRDLIATAYVNKVTGSTFGTETTLFTGAANTYHDLIYVLGSNDSTVAIGVDIRGTLAGNVLMHLEIPANGTVGIATPVPLPAGDVGASWTIDLPDVTGTNVYMSALFSKEI